MTPAEALAPIVGALEADGYGAVVEQRGDAISIRITAGPDACEECLTPKRIMEPMIAHALRSAGFEQRVELEYPAPEG